MTTLRLGEGLVGLVAREAEPVNLSERPAHAAFCLPAGDRRGDLPLVPRRADPARRQTLGVLVVQNRDAPRLLARTRSEALETMAIVLAEMIASGELSALAKPGLEPAVRRPLHIRGLASPRASRSATWCCTSRAWSSPISSPTTSTRS